MNKKVYLVVFDWSTDDGNDVDIEVCKTYKKAVKRYNEIIENEKKPEISWAASAFKANGELEHNYELDELKPDLKKETECYWDLTCKVDWYLHNYLSIRIQELK